MRLIVLLALLLLAGCAARPVAPPPQAENYDALFDTFARSCIKSGHVGGSAEFNACMMTLAKQYTDMRSSRPPAYTPPASTTRRRNLDGSVTCRED